jgi:hypothetical protein
LFVALVSNFIFTGCLKIIKTFCYFKIHISLSVEQQQLPVSSLSVTYDPRDQISTFVG